MLKDTFMIIGLLQISHLKILKSLLFEHQMT